MSLFFSSVVSQCNKFIFSSPANHFIKNMSTVQESILVCVTNFKDGRNAKEFRENSQTSRMGVYRRRLCALILHGSMEVHRQFTLLNLSRVSKRCDILNRECGRVKNRGWLFDCDEKFFKKNLRIYRCVLRILPPHKGSGN